MFSFFLLFTLCLGLVYPGNAFASANYQKEVDTLVLDFENNKIFNKTEVLTQDYSIKPEEKSTYVDSEGKTHEIEPKAIFGPDGRYEVGAGDINKYVKFICHLRMTYPDGSHSVGTGFVVGKNIVVTAAHCLYDSENNQYASSVTVYPRRKDDNISFGAYTAKSARLHVTNMYAYDGNLAMHDIGIIELNTNVESKTGKMAMRVIPDDMLDNLKNQYITICGYPYYPDKIRQYTMKDKILSSKKYWHDGHCYGVIKYTLDTTGGQSGSAIHQDGFTAIGVHVGSTYENNVGAAFSTVMYNWIKSYIN